MKVPPEVIQAGYALLLALLSWLTTVVIRNQQRIGRGQKQALAEAAAVSAVGAAEERGRAGLAGPEKLQYAKDAFRDLAPHLKLNERQLDHTLHAALDVVRPALQFTDTEPGEAPVFSGITPLPLRAGAADNKERGDAS